MDVSWKRGKKTEKRRGEKWPIAEIFVVA